MMKRHNRGIFRLVAVALALVLTGCGGKTVTQVQPTSQPQQTGNTPMGRYIETSLTGDISGVESTLGLNVKEDGTVVFYAVTGSQVLRSTVQTDDTVSTEETSWGADLLAQSAGWDIWSIAELPDGSAVVLCRQGQSAMLFSCQASGCSQLTITDWPEPFYFGGEGQSQVPSAIYPAGEGFLAVLDDRVEYRAADGSKIRSFEGYMYLQPTDVSVSGDSLVIRDGQTSTLVRYDLNSGSQLGTNAYDMAQMSAAILLTQDCLYLSDQSGIYRQALTGDKWEQVLSGEGTSLGAPANYVSSFVVADGDRYIVSYGTGVQAFTYSTDVPAVPEQELTVYALEEFPILRQAISVFQSQNPNVRVTLQVPQVDDSNREDTIRALNTELLNGSGPDILVLDGLPVESYMEKGVLADLGTFIQSQPQLLSGIVNAQQYQGGIYTVPAQFTAPIVIGPAGQSLPDSLDALLQTVLSQTGSVPYLRIPETLWSEKGVFVMDWYERTLPMYLQGKTMDTQQMSTVFSQIQQLKDAMLADAQRCGIDLQSLMGGAVFVDEEVDDQVEVVDGGYADLREGTATIHITDLSGTGRLFPMTMLEAGQWQVASLFNANYFLPRCNVGIVKSSSQQELAQQFLAVLFGQSVQSAYVGVGLPVNEDALNSVIISTMTKDNGETSELAEQVLTVCRNLDTAVVSDSVIESAVRSQASKIQSGEVTAQEAVNAISDAVRLYLSE